MIESFSMFVTESITQFSEWLNVVSGGNQFLAASFIVVGSSLFYFCRRIPGMVYKGIKKRVIYRYVISTKQTNFSEYVDFNSEDIAINTVNSILIWHNYSWWFKLVKNFKEHTSPPLGYSDKIFIPDDGSYYIFYKGIFYCITYKTLSSKKSEGASNTSLRYELEVTISSFGFNKKDVTKLIDNINEEYPTKFPVELYLTDFDVIRSTPRLPITFKTKEDNYIKEEIVNDIYGKLDFFINNEDWYKENKLNYVESFLLHGLPGTGKSTIIETIVDHYELDMIVITNLTANLINSLTNHIKNRNNKKNKPLVVIIEDLETCEPILQNKGDLSDFDSERFASFKSLILNFFNGTNSPSNVIFLITTNYPEKLDEAMMRRGRINHHIEIPYLSNKEISNFIKKRYNIDYEFDEELIISIADLIHYYKTNVDDFDNFIKEFKEFIKSGNKINLSSDDYVRELKGSNNEN